MTIPVQIPQNSYAGDGVQDTFAFTFRILENDDLSVFVDSVLQVEGSNYDLANITNLGGDVVFQAGSIPILNAIIVLDRFTDKDQQTVYDPFDPFPAKTHELALDKLTMLMQEVEQTIVNNPGQGLPLDPTGVFWDALSRRIKNIVSPIDGQDAATKSYVDAVSGAGFDPSLDQSITGLWTFLQQIVGTTTGNLVTADLADYTQRIITEAILAQWTFADGAGSQRKVGARNPRERLIIANDTPNQSDEGAILRIADVAVTSISLQELEAQTTFTILADAAGYTLSQTGAVIINFFDGLGSAPPTGNRTIARASSIQVVYETTSEVSIYGNGIG